ncbi:hypothetical protein [Microbacterium sp. NPDC076895]|uniref:hypothetical protein n=1 Tax=Microbacterium sp. NPDC076895 TaxID=3154957 RepID=UPI003433C938
MEPESKTERRIPIDDGNVIDYSVLALSELLEDRSTPPAERRQFDHAMQALADLSLAMFRHLPRGEALALEMGEADARVCLNALKRYIAMDRLPDFLRHDDDPDRLSHLADGLEARLVA